MKVGDLVRMLPKNYSSPGCYVPDQWQGLTAIVTDDHGDPEGNMFSALIRHPDDPAQSEILISIKDVEVISEYTVPVP